MIVPWRFLVAGLILVGASGLAYALRPVPLVELREVDLQRQIPVSFGEWREVRTGLVQADLAPRGENGQQEASLPWPYDKTLSRVYQRTDGQIIMLALAWGSKQRQEIKVHRPELCYAGQGFHVVDQRYLPLELSPATHVQATKLITIASSRVEPVIYWIRIGNKISLSAWQSRGEIFREGLLGRIPDGILVRVSQALASENEVDRSFDVLEEFLRDLYTHLDQGGRKLLVPMSVHG